MCWTPTTLSPAGKFILVCSAFVNPEIRSNQILAEKKIYFYAIFQLFGRLGGNCTTLFLWLRQVPCDCTTLVGEGLMMMQSPGYPGQNLGWLYNLSPFCMGFHLFMRSSSLESCVHVVRQLIRWVMIGEELVAAAISVRGSSLLLQHTPLWVCLHGCTRSVTPTWGDQRVVKNRTKLKIEGTINNAEQCGCGHGCECPCVPVILPWIIALGSIVTYCCLC